MTPHRFTSITLLAGLGLCGIPPACSAGQNANAKILLHLWHGWKATMESPRVAASCVRLPKCGEIRTSAPLYPEGSHWPYTIILLTDGNVDAGLAGVEFGISYDPTPEKGVDIFAWTLCADHEFPSAGPHGAWPASLSSNRILWDTSVSCQRTEPGGPGTGVVAAAGYFYVAAYTPDELAVIPSLASGVARVWSCAGVADTVEGGGVVRTPSHLGIARYSSSSLGNLGYNPCGLNTPVAPSTWGRIKALR